MNRAHTKFVSATPSTVTVEVLMSCRGMEINCTLGAKSKNIQLKTKTTLSAGAAAAGRIANLN